MKNSHVKEKLSEYIDGILDEEGASVVRNHLDRCPECLEEYREMIRIIGHMSQMERLESPDSFVEKVHNRIEKQSSIQRLVKGLFYPLKIKVPLELAGVAAAALLVIYIVGIRGKQHVYELAYVQRSQTPTVLQEQAQETGAEVDKTVILSKKSQAELGLEEKKAEPVLKFKGEKVSKGDKRIEVKEALAPSKDELPALERTEKRMEKQAQDEEALAHRKIVEEEAAVDLEPMEEAIERKAQIEVKTPRTARAQRRENLSLEVADKEKGKTEKDALAKPEPGEKYLDDILTALGGKIIESEYDKETRALKSLVIEIPAEQYQKLIQTLGAWGDIQKPYPVIKEKGQNTIRVHIRLRKKT